MLLAGVLLQAGYCIVLLRGGAAAKQSWSIVCWHVPAPIRLAPWLELQSTRPVPAYSSGGQ
jgi:hypothetical protein